MAETDWDVQLEPVKVTGPGVVAKVPGGVIFTPEEIRGEIVGLPWRVEFVIRLSEDDEVVPEVAECRVSQRPDGPPVGADALRAVPIGEARLRAVQAASSEWVNTAAGRRLSFQPPASYQVDTRTKRAHHRVTDDQLQAAADAYAEAKQLGRRAHLLFIADSLHVSRATAARYLERARVAGMVDG